MSDSVFACTLQRAYVAQEVVTEFAQISVRVLMLNQHLQGGEEGVGVEVRGMGLRGHSMLHTACWELAQTWEFKGLDCLQFASWKET